jgi:hypothetical protein
VIYIQRRDRIRPAHRSLSRQKLTGLVCYEAFGAATPKALSFATDRQRSRFFNGAISALSIAIYLRFDFQRLIRTTDQKL